MTFPDATRDDSKATPNSTTPLTLLELEDPDTLRGTQRHKNSGADVLDAATTLSAFDLFPAVNSWTKNLAGIFTLEPVHPASLASADLPCVPATGGIKRCNKATQRRDWDDPGLFSLTAGEQKLQIPECCWVSPFKPLRNKDKTIRRARSAFVGSG